MDKENLCAYVSPENKPCGRSKLAESDDKCIFHQGAKGKSKSEFEEALRSLVQNQDGNWAGFFYPKGIELHKFNVDFDVDARWSEYFSVTFNKVNFQGKVDFRHSKFDNGATFTSSFWSNSRLDFSDCIFRGDTKFHALHYGETYFQNCCFQGRVYFSGDFKSQVSFSRSEFHEDADFRGGSAIIRIGGTENSNSQEVKKKH
ncbi:MAG: pentapeptide repeat-containing protein [Gammaproteobacteria bacterium]|nr:pentapeptide repeat-containing protein [Gammaproteobacteria bacterium]